MQRSFIFQWTQLQRKLAGMEDARPPPPGGPAWSPNTDVFEGPNGLIVRVELAGVPLDGIEIQLDDQVLVIRGVRRDPQNSATAAGYRFRQMEMDYGPFERVLPLPFAVDGDHAAAAMHLGVLTINLPRAAVPRPTHVHIQVGH